MRMIAVVGFVAMAATPVGQRRARPASAGHEPPTPPGRWRWSRSRPPIWRASPRPRSWRGSTSPTPGPAARSSARRWTRTGTGTSTGWCSRPTSPRARRRSSAWSPRLRATGLRRVPRLRALRPRAPRRLRLGERRGGVPDLRAGARDVRARAAHEQRGGRLEQEDARLAMNEWYLEDDYHRDHGDGGDFYPAGKTRGCGGSGARERTARSPSRRTSAHACSPPGPFASSSRCLPGWETPALRRRR